jgi:hypothetical protein
MKWTPFSAPAASRIELFGAPPASRTNLFGARAASAVKRTLFSAAAAVLIGAAALAPGVASAQDDARAFADTGYSIADDNIWSFFNQYGGVATFGEPISREFTLAGQPVQLFENAALAVQPDGSVQSLQLSDPGLVPYTRLNGLTVPATDQALAFVAPSPDQPNYDARLQVYLKATVPDTWNGQPVGFYSTFTNTGGVAVWGLPTSSAAADPNNPGFVYQRFQNGILFYDASAGSTQALPLGEYLKDILTGQNLPSDLALEAAGSSLLGQYQHADAFVPDAG